MDLNAANHTLVTEDVTPEPRRAKTLLAQHLETAVEALREREMAFSTRSAVNCEQSYACCPSGRCAKSELARTRAALDVVERWAAAELNPGVIDAIVAKQPLAPCAWYVKEQRIGDDVAQFVEREALYILAAALECRHRNGEVG